MAVFFSINHGCILAVLSISNLLLGQEQGSYQSGSLYVTYTVTALVLSPGLLDLLGARKALIWAAALYSIYVISFPIALVIPKSMSALETIVALIGGIVGGFAAGFLWSAQGTYFAMNAKNYAYQHNVTLSEANSLFASIFAFVFLALEVTLKLLPVALTELSHIKLYIWGDSNHPVSVQDLVIASLYSVLAVASVFGLATINELVDEQADAEATITTPNAVELLEDDKATSLLSSHAPKPMLRFEKAAAAITLWAKHPSVLLLAPIQITFGVSASLLYNEVTFKVVKYKFGDNNVVIGSLLSALIAFIAAVLQVPFKHLAVKLGKPPLMITCIFAFVLLAALVLAFPIPPAPSPPAPPGLLPPSAPPPADSHSEGVTLGNLGLLLSCYVLQGIGRAGYEGTNKALYADFFPNDSTAAFSNIILANGLSSAVSFFVFPSLDKTTIATIALVCSSTTVVCYLLAEYIHRAQVARVASAPP